MESVGWCRVYLLCIYIYYIILQDSACIIQIWIHFEYNQFYMTATPKRSILLTTFPSMEKPARWGNPRATVTFEWHGGTHYRLVQKSRLECSNEKTVFWQQFAWTVSIFSNIFQERVGKNTHTHTLVKEMTCVLYSWKICWSGGCLIEIIWACWFLQFGKTPPKWPWRLGVLRSSSSRMLDWDYLFSKR